MSVLPLPLAGPSRSSRMAVRHRVQTVRFGGGRSVRIRDGHTAPETSWQVIWNGISTAKTAEMDAFLRARNGVEGFIWQPPGEASGQVFVCSEWQVTPISPGYSRLEARFTRLGNGDG